MEKSVQELFGSRGSIGRLCFLALLGLLGGAGAGVLSEGQGHGAESDTKAEREYENFLH
jgi:hypothetical protein